MTDRKAAVDAAAEAIDSEFVSADGRSRPRWSRDLALAAVDAAVPHLAPTPAPIDPAMAHCAECPHRLGSGCGCECCDPSALILRAISDPGSITPRRRTCGNCQRVLVDEDEAGWYYQAPVTDPEVPGLTFMDRVHECHGAPHAVDLESMLQWQARAAVQAALPVVRAAIYAELGNDHYVIFTEDRWTVEHSVECKLSGHMHECGMHTAVARFATGYDPDMPGRWRITGIDSEGLPELERADV